MRNELFHGSLSKGRKDIPALVVSKSSPCDLFQESNPKIRHACFQELAEIQHMLVEGPK